MRAFVERCHALGRPLQVLLNNAAVYLPRLKAPQRSSEGDEISVATNNLGHFLLNRLLLDHLRHAAAATGSKARLITLGTVTANSEEFGGQVPNPASANLGDLQGLEAGFLAPVAMIDGKPFKPVKAYKDSKLCNMIINREWHRRDRPETGIVFSTRHPAPGTRHPAPGLRGRHRLVPRNAPGLRHDLPLVPEIHLSR